MSVTLLIIIVTGLISAQALNNRNVFDSLRHHPYTEHRSKEYFRLLSAGFLHGSWLHLIVNMYVLHIFGGHVEREFLVDFGVTKGRIFYLLFYLLGIIAGCLPTFLKHKDNSSFASIGASGAVSSVLFAFVYFYPWSELRLFFAIPIPAIVFAVLYLGYSSYAGNKGGRTIIDHLGHFGGAVWGIIAIVGLMSHRLDDFLEALMNVPNFSIF